MTVRNIALAALILTAGLLTRPGQAGSQERPVRPADQAPGEGFWADYRFIPGDRVLFYEDYRGLPVTELPPRLEILKGAPKLTERSNHRFLLVNRHAAFRITLPDTLPANFTLEFDLWLPGGVVSVFCPVGDGQNFRQKPFFQFRANESGVKFGHSAGAVSDLTRGGPIRDLWNCRIAGDGKRLTMYVNNTRIADTPDPGFLRGKQIQFDVQNSSREDILFGPIRVAEGRARTLAEALAAEGRAITHGITFDPDDDRLRPESTPVLKEIAALLQDNPKLRLQIEVHTDNSGDYKSNQERSQRQAVAVREFLVSHFELNEDRLSAKGFGESKPIASGSTPEAAQENLRVEIVKR
ncbi:MAG: OmpA family protein [Candidatus Zixiibacteriota bacterium]